MRGKMEIAIIKVKSKQYKVSKGQVLLVEHIKGKKVKEKVKFKDLLFGKDVDACILGEEKGKKVVIFKNNARNRYQRKTGHRQIYTKLEIEEIK